MNMRRSLIILLLAALPLRAIPAQHARAWRVAHEQAIVRELMDLLAIPNLASDKVNIERNADAIVTLFAKRGIEARLLRVEGAPPIVVADVAGKDKKTTVAFYAHYDGQPVDPAQWQSPPWEPVLRPDVIAPESHVYARSASDDKAPIIAMLAALDAMKDANEQPSVNLKFVFEGEEEAGSPHLKQYLDKYDFDATLWILCDGPVHQSRRLQLYFGARGVTDLEITVYGPSRALHSGHYGNWAPNPIVMLTHLIDSMRDENAHILIEGFYDDVRPLTDAERRALQEIPDVDAQLRTELALGRTEGKSLNEQILAPALNLRGIAAGKVGEQASNTINTEAKASIDFRLVPDETPRSVREKVERHIRKQGYFIVSDTPDAATRMAHEKITKLTWGAGYPPARTSMELPAAKRVAKIMEEAMGQAPVRMPSLGGSIPMYLFQRGGTVPVIGLPIVNHDNNQHAANENLRLQNLWDGIEVFAALFTGM